MSIQPILFEYHARHRLAGMVYFQGLYPLPIAARMFAMRTDETFRAQLILFSIKDHEQDTRDAIVLLHNLCQTARSADIKTGPILEEVAELSSDVNKYGMGSTRSILRNAVPKSSS